MQAAPRSHETKEERWLVGVRVESGLKVRWQIPQSAVASEGLFIVRGRRAEVFKDVNHHFFAGRRDRRSAVFKWTQHRLLGRLWHVPLSH